MEINYKRLTNEQFFMGVAELARLKSNDPRTKVGCCIVNGRKNYGEIRNEKANSFMPFSY